MNTSPHINPDICLNVCEAQCCKTFTLQLTGNYPPNLVQRINAMASGDKIKAHKEAGAVLIEFDYPCAFLDGNICLVYNDPTRPRLCEEYPGGYDRVCPYKKK